MIDSENLLHIADTVSKDKDIPKEELFIALEIGIIEVSKRKYGQNLEIKAHINRKNGEIKIYSCKKLVEAYPEENEILTKEAQLINPELITGQELFEELPPIVIDRHNAKIVRNFVYDYLLNFEKQKEYDSFEDKIGHMYSCVVKKVIHNRNNYNNKTVITDLGGRAEAILPHGNYLSQDSFKAGDHIKAVISKVQRSNYSAQIFLSRTEDALLKNLLELEVPEISDNKVVIKAIVREAGVKSKVAVFSTDPTIDPAGACVGMRGKRIFNVSSELKGERIDVVIWDQDIIKYAINAIGTEGISKIVINNQQNKLVVVIDEENRKIAIGKNGVNVRLASRLLGFNIEIITEDERSQETKAVYTSQVNTLVENLNIDEVLAQILVSNGYISIEDIANAEAGQLVKVTDLSESDMESLIDKACIYTDKANEELLNQLDALGVGQDLLDLFAEHLSTINLEQIVTLAESGIKSLEDLQEINKEEFIHILNKKIDRHEVENLFNALTEEYQEN